MRKEELEINGKIIVVMEQPASFVLDLEKSFHDKQLVGYCREILKYPAGANPNLEDIIKIPNSIKYEDLELSLLDKTGVKNLYLAEEIFCSFEQNKQSVGFVGEVFLEKVGKNINDFKYSEVAKIGKEVMNQLKDFLYLIEIRGTFRRF